MNERLIVEAVPWIDSKLARGWTKDLKDTMYSWCMHAEDMEMKNKNQFCACLVSKIEEKYTLTEFGELSVADFATIEKTIGMECYDQSGEDATLIEEVRVELANYAQENNYPKAADAAVSIIEDYKSSEPNDYNSVGWHLILNKQYLLALKYLTKGEQYDPYNLYIKGNLAHAYLLNGEYDKAMTIYKKYVGQNLNSTMSWLQMIKLDFDSFIQAGINSDSMQKVMDELGINK